MDFTAGQIIVIVLWTFICAGIAYEMGIEQGEANIENEFQEKWKELINERDRKNGKIEYMD